jgi:hypothetical protein
MDTVKEFYLLRVEASSIQDYIFGSNRLRENIGASYLVAAVTGEWALKVVADPELAMKSNLNDDSATIERDNLDVEVLYSGGGNFVALFRTEDAAKKFTRNLSKRVLEQAPGLKVHIHSVKFELGKDILHEKLTCLSRELKQKGSASNVMPLAGLGVTVMCGSTSLPAVGLVDKKPVSAEVLAKLNSADAANAYLKTEIPPGEGYAYPTDFDDLGRTRGESSLIAIVHADGDGIGKAIIELGNEYSTADKARDHIKALRTFSAEIKKASKEALKATLESLFSAFAVSAEVANLIPHNKRDPSGRLYLPFRPLVFGGDDVTFVCDGRIGIPLALEYLRLFKQHMATLKNDPPFTASAGIAIVKSHYPFARAYALAENLCKQAKDFRRKSGAQGSCLDWHLAMTGLAGELDEIRHREYSTPHGSLTLRPVMLDGAELRSWKTVEKGLNAFQSDVWQDKRNKAKMLREKLREGPDAVAEFVTLYGQKLPSINGIHNGWSNDDSNGDSGKLCGYFDAIELMDLYLPLTGDTPDETHPEN